MRRVLIAVVLLAMAAAACSATAGQGTTPTGPGGPGTTLSPSRPEGSATGTLSGIASTFDPGSVRFEAALMRFDSCDALLGYFREEALARVGPYGLNGGPTYYPGPWLAERDFEAAGDGMAETTMAATTVPQGLGEGNGGYSTTNVQVAGVDEPDTIKTDGERILTVMNGVLYYVDVEGAAGRLAGSLTLPEGWNHRFFMSGDRALVFSQGDGYAMPFIEDAARIMPVWNGPVTLVHEVDLSDPAAMRIVRTLRLEGGYLSARAIDGTVRMVISAYPSDLPFVYPSGPAAEDLALETNKRVIEQSTLEDWLPSYTLFAGDEVMEQGLLVDCEQTHHPVEFAGFDTLAVVTLDLEGRLDPAAAAAVIADGETVYASTERLYVATNVWVPAELIGDARLASMEEDYSTAIHAFDITGEGPARYLASGAVDGHLLNQFSMDEYQGHLRVATTDGSPWSATDASKSAVSVLTVDGERLVEVGRVGDLGRGESIYSVRFVGPTGYVVTFRQTDPLYVVDLRDPEAPRVASELKITGYSAYLHPLDEGRLLGVGREATEDGRVTGAKVTLFDVSDPADPRAIDSWQLADGYTDVEYDHLAFLYWAPEEIVVLPMQDWSDNFVGAIVLKVDDGVREVNRIVHEPDETEAASDCRQVEFGKEGEMVVQVCESGDQGGFGGGYYCEVYPADQAPDMLAAYGLGEVEIGDDERLEICWPNYYGPAQITRSLVIGDSLWTLSWIGLQANALDGFEVTGKVRLG
ncbi:MAG: beta-propeller domain-containing protein [Acidimicrobiia bacterium]|nr:beta-propeller domain-containing protein [Acidimicrobiia bacterium]